MRKIGLLGGTGFIGKHILSRWIKKGWQIRVLTRSREQHREILVLPSVELIAMDVYDQEQLNKQLSGCDVVINLVGILNESGNDGSGFHKAHVELAQKVLVAMQANNIKRLLHVSALNADAEAGKSHYLRTKGAAEDLVHQADGLNVTSFRPSLIFGENTPFFNKFGALLSVPSPLFMLPSGHAKFAPVWINDVIEAMALTLVNSEHYGKRYNLCGPKVYTLKELVVYLAKLMEVTRYVLPLEDKTSYWVANVMEKLVPGKPYSLDNFYSSQVESVCGDNNHLPQLGITPRTMESIMPRYYSNATTPRELYSAFRMQSDRWSHAIKD